jgi:uncharacterized damage-inducible protein DinB
LLRFSFIPLPDLRPAWYFSSMSTPISDSERYPIGKFQPPSSYTAETRRRAMETLHELPARLASAVSGLSDAQLDTPYREGGWTLRQVVHHIADSHANSFIRFKLALTEENPAIKPYDENAWANLADSRLPVDVSLRMTAAIHERWIALLEAMSGADFARGFMHPENGLLTLDLALAIYAWHSLHHTAHITRLRERKGW